ncbi:hypothetical protein FF1_042666 [Malus domestica]
MSKLPGKCMRGSMAAWTTSELLDCPIPIYQLPNLFNCPCFRLAIAMVPFFKYLPGAISLIKSLRCGLFWEVLFRFK